MTACCDGWKTCIEIGCACVGEEVPRCSCHSASCPNYETDDEFWDDEPEGEE
jgi:hypothetical protein